jgi:hypothetical protein
MLAVLTAILLGAGAQLAPRPTRSEIMPEKMSQLVGHWEKLTDSPCSRVYPKLLEFRAEGLYSGTGIEPGNAPGWDIGTWQIAGPTQVKISTVNDAVITYEFSLSGDILTFVDLDKCEFRYRRVDRGFNTDRHPAVHLN